MRIIGRVDKEDGRTGCVLGVGEGVKGKVGFWIMRGEGG